MGKDQQLVIYQTRSGALELKGDVRRETIWADLQQIADLFETDKSGISRHIANVYKSGELRREATVAKFATVQKEGRREIQRQITYYNLDIILSVGYRVNSIKATLFRQWATKILRQHIGAGFTINRTRVKKNYQVFLKAVEDIKLLLPQSMEETSNITELIKSFAQTWLSLEAYDTDELPRVGATLRQVEFTAEELIGDIVKLKENMVTKQKVTSLFAAERGNGLVAGIVGNVFQSFGGEDVYPSVELKAANLLYFMVKNHPFADGNKRSGAFAFIWFLNKAGLLDRRKLSPEAVAAMTLLTAESKPNDKEKMVGLIVLLL